MPVASDSRSVHEKTPNEGSLRSLAVSAAIGLMPITGGVTRGTYDAKRVGAQRDGCLASAR